MNRLLVTILTFFSFNSLAQSLISVDDLTRLAICGDDFECIQSIIQKNMFIADEEEDGSVKLKYSNQESTYLEIRLNDGNAHSTIILYTYKTTLFDKFITSKLEIENYKKDFADGISSYSRTLDKFKVSIHITDEKNNDKIPIKFLYLILSPL